MSVCVVEGCDREPHARSYCRTHDRQLQRRGTVGPIRTMAPPSDTTARDERGRKRCARCETWQDESEFYELAHTKDGLNSHCKSCMKWGNALRLFGVTPERFAELLAAQGGGCAICNIEPTPTGRRFAIDHDRTCCPGDRTCGLCVRGILCPSCNTGIGLLRDNTEILQGAIEYLEAWSA